MAKKRIGRVAIVAEDLAPLSTTSQTRSGETVSVRAISAETLPYDATKNIKQAIIDAGGATDLSGHATTQELQTETDARIAGDTEEARLREFGLAGKVVKTDYDIDKTALEAEDTRIDGKTDANMLKLQELAQEVMDLPELPIDADGVRLARLAREANLLATQTNATDISTLRTDSPGIADSRIRTQLLSGGSIKQVFDGLGVISTPAEITQSANNAITTSLASGAIKTRLDELTVGSGLQLSAFQAGVLVGKTCNLTFGDVQPLGGLDTTDVYVNILCSPEPNEDIVADLSFNLEGSRPYTMVLLVGDSSNIEIQPSSSTTQSAEFSSIHIPLGSSLRLRVHASDTNDVGSPTLSSGSLTYQGFQDGEAVDAIRILVEEAQTPDLFQTVSDNIPFNHPFKESSATQTTPAVETFTFSSDFEGIGVGKVVKIDSYFDFDLNPSNGSLPRCELTIMQAGRILSYTDYMDAQTANPISYKAVAGGGAITFIGKATSTNELTQLVHMYTSDQTVYVEGRYAPIFNQLMDAGIALATASLKSRLTNLENLPVQDITALQNSYDNLLAQVNNPVLQALSHGTVSNESGYIVARSPLGDKWQAVLEFTSSPYQRRVLTNSANIGATLTAGAQQAVIGEFKDGAFYGKSAQHTVITPARTDTVDDAYGFPFTIALGTQNQHRESTTSFEPTQQIPSGAVLQARLSMNIAGGSPAEFNLALGESNVFTNSGETATVLFQLFEGKPTLYITEGGENSLPLDNGTLTGFIRYTNEVAQTTETIPASETRLFEGHAPIIVEAENATASTASNLTIIYGNNQRFDTHTSGAYQDFYVEQNEATKEIFSIIDSESYNLTELDITQYRMGLWTRTPHQSQLVDILTGLKITHTDGGKIDVGAEITALKASGGGGVAKGEFGDFLETTYPSFEVDLSSSISVVVPHDLTHNCEIRGARVEVLEALTFTGGGAGVRPRLDGSSYFSSSGSYALSKVGDSITYYSNSGDNRFLDSSSDILINSCDSAGFNGGSASGKVVLILVCQRMTK